MSDLIAMSFDNEFKADEVLNTLAKLQKEHLIDLEDAAIVVKNAEGKVKLKQALNLVTAGAVTGGFWGLLFGTLFLSPLLGVAVGAATGALSGKASDIGVNDDFMKELGETLIPGTSAIFVLVRKATPDRVIEELKPFNGKILRTSLSADDEEQLKAALEA
ncbi:DUF1269 domain-containing protein [Limnoraphis robusta Tam1]|uniref:DUF1269 domain-containing protein n=1 Tax=Limnoraphis robusta CCNP1315 TaxID=3110306 RepID=A0ABU5U1E1_9CYAN|nr:DUF1269 domain-containing protein [Limnoraphis robusta]MEA5500928.1 DUF1269 domain-containing protein [Limnoraphis robusta BA-68 BA1]MEA5520737.1 DUF1269 domain-containing protein [Limnoraphis robusta CCNP1315]MEA5540255.1 DUF1269 domain-containing protein [Limnoraphis robusta Tam1]MEA5544400.1 DUF1269 domain-containing protein [Limnoraphis robusta CCNP1324]